jgi:hypothetical protein
LIIGFITFLPTIGHGDGELQIFSMAVGLIAILFALVALIVAFVRRLMKTRIYLKR